MFAQVVDRRPRPLPGGEHSRWRGIRHHGLWRSCGCGGLLASVDGMRFVVPPRATYACPNPQCLGRKRGITWLNMLSDQSAGLTAKAMFARHATR
ncbi:Tn3 family transposase [Nocardia sp. NPDC001965]